MRKNSTRHCAMPVRRAVCAAALLLFAVFFATGCSGNAGGQTLKLPEGGSVSWNPAAPLIGDLVSVESFVPESPAESAPGDSGTSANALRGPDGSLVAPILTEIVRNGKNIRWSFRVTRSGSWTIDAADGKKQTLWTVATVSGEASELKKIDTQYLWTGKKPKGEPAQTSSPQSGSPQAVSP